MIDWTYTTVLVAGGTGGVGEGIVRALLRQGARVVATSRSERKLKGLQEYVADLDIGELVPVVGSLSSEDEANALRDAIYQAVGPLDIVVASLGGWQQGTPITGVAVSTWEQVVRNNLTSHFLAMKAFVPLLDPKEGVYVHINGFSAEQAYAGAGPIAAMAAAQKSLALTLAEELQATGTQVYEFILGPIKTRARLRRGHGQPGWYTAEEIGDYLVGLVEERNADVIHRLMEKREEEGSV